MSAGYSDKALVDKLGIKEGNVVLLMNPPDGYLDTLGALPKGAVIVDRSVIPVPVAHYFATRRKDLEKRFPALMAGIRMNGMVWVSWPKGGSAIETDLNENVVREIGLATGLVDVKVCAIDENWSGLKFVFRKEDR